MTISFHLVAPTTFYVMRVNEDSGEAALDGVLTMHDGQWVFGRQPDTTQPVRMHRYPPDIDLLSVIQLVDKEAKS